jgi:hypothetical protein
MEFLFELPGNEKIGGILLKCRLGVLADLALFANGNSLNR